MTTLAEPPAAPELERAGRPRWVKVLDQTRCIGCHACTTACKSENDVPLGVSRTYVKSVDVGHFPQVRRAFQVTRCNQCEDAPCVAACPTGAMQKRPDGIVDFDKSVCIGCKACIAACPYDAIFINPEDHSAEKCNFCAHRLDIGLEPACVVVCPTEAILVGDLNDPSSKVARIVQREPVAVRRPDKATRPKVFYVGAHQATLDPLAAGRPEGTTFAWAQLPPRGQVLSGSHEKVSGHPAHANSSADVLLSYDGAHRARFYTWTKGYAAGAYASAGAILVAVLAVVAGRLHWHDALGVFLAPLAALSVLAITGVLLIWDLKHPLRFYMIFTKHQWRSWLVRGSVAISFYGAAATAMLGAGIADARTAQEISAAFAVAGGLAVACYTAWLFAQAKARDLWQSPLLPPHLAVQAVLVGGAVLLAVAHGIGPHGAVPALAAAVGAAAAAHLLFVAGEATLTHPTAHAHLAAREMTRGRFAPAFWAGVVLVAAAVAAPWIGVAAIPLALVGLICHEHAYVQAGQAVPLA